jgi:hypothetical protein
VPVVVQMWSEQPNAFLSPEFVALVEELFAEEAERGALLGYDELLITWASPSGELPGVVHEPYGPGPCDEPASPAIAPSAPLARSRCAAAPCPR